MEDANNDTLTSAAQASISSMGKGSAGRAGRLPVRSLLVSELSKVRSRASSLFQVLESATNGKRDNASRSTVDQAFRDLLQASGRLRAATQVLYDHQQFQSKLIYLEEEIRSKDAEIVKISKVMRQAQSDVEKVLFEQAKPLLGKSSGEVVRPVDAGIVLDYARKLSYSTAAPPGWHYSQGIDIPFPFKPPAPQEEVIRKGHLFSRLQTTLKRMIKANQSKDQVQDEVHSTDSTNRANRKRKASREELDADGDGEPPAKKQDTTSKPEEDDKDLLDI